LITVFGLKKLCVCGALSLFLTAISSSGQKTTPEPQLHTDTDHDGLTDALEQRLLTQFMPKFMVAEHDCSVSPAEFKPEMRTPAVESDNGTIYGQAFPSHDGGDRALFVELHYYHLWRKDCGPHGHPLDTEHVAVLVRASDTHLSSATWKAVYWYAAAHENTVCDVSQIARASTLHAEDHGATVWISPGKHASYLNETLCHRGCGADRCEVMTQLVPVALINLGEPGFPMNRSLFTSSSAWPLEAKMLTSNFPPAPIARLDGLPASDIAWFNPGRHPVQGIIAKSSTTEQVLANSSRNTISAISVAQSSTGNALASSGDSTSNAISTAEDSTGNALQRSYTNTRHALGKSVWQAGKAMHLTPEATHAQTDPPK
jgi:hypothetical protein